MELAYTADLKSAAFWLAGSSPALATFFLDKFNLFWYTISIQNKDSASVAQWIEHRTSNPQVVGSTPTWGANYSGDSKWLIK